MARLTNAQLSAQLEEAHVKYERLAHKHACLQADYDDLVRAGTSRTERPAPRSTRVMRGGRAYDKVCVGWNRYVYREVQ